MSHFRNDTLTICKVCDVRISEMVEFLNIDRVHMQQGIFPDVQQSYMLHCQLTFDEVSCKVLVGAPLKQNEFLKIDQTCFADVIAEEAGNEHMRQGSPQDKMKESGEGEEREGKGEGEKMVAFASEVKTIDRDYSEGLEREEVSLIYTLATV